MELSYRTKDGSNGYGKNKIFVSYRKADREYAMQACNDLLAAEIESDIAVWYDDPKSSI